VMRFYSRSNGRCTGIARGRARCIARSPQLSNRACLPLLQVSYDCCGILSGDTFALSFTPGLNQPLPVQPVPQRPNCYLYQVRWGKGGGGEAEQGRFLVAPHLPQRPLHTWACPLLV
jgi:hypothetical protein